MSSSYNINVIFVWQPSPSYNYDLNYHLFSKEGFGNLTYSKFAYPQIRELEKKGALGRNFFWCADIQNGIKDPLYVDKIHYSARMSREFAHYIFDLLIERDLLTVRRRHSS